jgi:hypothetical protein
MFVLTLVLLFLDLFSFAVMKLFANDTVVMIAGSAHVIITFSALALAWENKERMNKRPERPVSAISYWSRIFIPPMVIGVFIARSLQDSYFFSMGDTLLTWAIFGMPIGLILLLAPSTFVNLVIFTWPKHKYQ